MADDDSNFMSGISIGICCGMALGIAVGMKSFHKEPAEIIMEDRNKDGIADIVQKYRRGEEKVLYAHKKEDGTTEYKPSSE